MVHVICKCNENKYLYPVCSKMQNLSLKKILIKFRTIRDMHTDYFLQKILNKNEERFDPFPGMIRPKIN